MHSTKGFTLIELMVAVAVLAVLIGIAVPNFANIVRANRAESQRATLINSFNLARAEAIRRSMQVGISPLTGTTNWSVGWRIWADANGNGSFDGGETIKEFPALTGGNALTTTATPILFNAQGYQAGVVLGASRTLEFRVGTAYCTMERNITVNHLGRVVSQRRAC